MKSRYIFIIFLSVLMLGSCTPPKRPIHSSSSEIPTSTSILSTSEVTPSTSSVSTTSSPISSTSSITPIIPILKKIELDRTNLNFNLNPSKFYGSEILTTSFEGEGDYSTDVEWITSNENVATVDEGLVTAVTVGECSITVRSTVYENIEATCLVSVINDEPTVTMVSVDPSSGIIDLHYDNTKQFTAMVYGENNPSQDVIWSVNNGAQIENGLVTVTKKGTYTVTATSVIDNQKSGSATLIVNDTTPVVTSVTVTPSTSTLDLYEKSSTPSSVQLTAKVYGTNYPSQEVTWRSSNEAVAKVSNNGLVTAIGKGSAVIYADSVEDSRKSGSSKITVVDTTPIVKSITVQESISVHIGSTGKIVATVNGDNLTTEAKKVIWSIEDTTIASIASDGTITPKKLGTTTITVTSEYNPSVSAKSTLIVDEESKKDAYTILLYISGCNLESDGGYATDNINAILAAGKIPSGVNIVIETGGSTSWKNSNYGNRSYLTRLHVEGSSIVRDSQISRTDMSKSSTLQSFIEYGLTNYDAEQVGLILWNHGGAMGGVCSDYLASDTYDALNTTEVHSAVAGAFSKLGRSASDKLTWIGYDACLMGVADIATVNSDYFEYMVGAEESEAGDGWDYTTWVKALYANPSITPKELLSKICTSFVNQFGSSSYNNQTLAAYDLSKINALVTAFNQYVSNINPGNNWTSVKTAYNSSLKFGEDSGIYSFSVADFNDFLTKLKTQSAFSGYDQTNVQTALSNMIIANAYGKYYSSTKPCGATLFVPCDSYYASTSKSDYSGSNNTRFSAWQTVCLNNGTFSYY